MSTRLFSSSPRLASLGLLAAFSVGLLGCASSGSGGAGGVGGSGDSLRVTLRDYKTGMHFELVSEAHTDRVAYYSTVRQGAARKIQADEVMDALVDELRRQGFRQHAQEGRAPTRPSEILSRSLECQRGGTVTHWAIGRGSDPREWQRFNDCVGTFLELYNVTSSFQTVENPSGKEFFQESSSGRT